MRELIKQIDEKIKRLKTYELSLYEDGYIAALEDCKEWIDKAADDMIVVGNVYYVVIYENGNKYTPRIEKMKLFKINENRGKTYFFSRNMNANPAVTKVAHLRITGIRNVRSRIFFTYDEALKAIGEK